MLILSTNSISDKILVLQLWAKMLSASQNARFFRMYYLKKEVNDEVYFWLADKHKTSTSRYYHFECVQPGMSKVRKIRSLHIFAISPEKYGGEVGFLPANKHKRFLQFDSIFLSLRSQACPKYLKQ